MLNWVIGTGGGDDEATAVGDAVVVDGVRYEVVTAGDLEVGDVITERDEGLTLDDYDWDCTPWSKVVRKRETHDGSLLLTFFDDPTKSYHGWKDQLTIRRVEEK